jgi:hypothetical protein
MSGAPMPNILFHSGKTPFVISSQANFHHGINWVNGVPQNNALPVKIIGAKRIIGKTSKGK